MQTTIVTEGQTIADIALQQYGNAADGILALIKDNPELGGGDSYLMPGIAIQIRELGAAGFDNDLRRLINARSVRPNSGEVIPSGAGIGSMIIESTFIIS